MKNPCFLVVFLAFFPQKNQERKDRVLFSKTQQRKRPINLRKIPAHRPGVPGTSGATNRVHRPVSQGLPVVYQRKKQGGPGSVRLRFGGGTVRAVPVFGSGGSSTKQQFNRKGRFRFRFRFLENGSGGSGSAFGFGENGSDGSGFPVPVRFLSHPEKNRQGHLFCRDTSRVS